MDIFFDINFTRREFEIQFEIDKLNVKLPSGKIEIKEDIHTRRIISAYFHSIAQNPIQKFIGTLLVLWRK